MKRAVRTILRTMALGLRRMSEVLLRRLGEPPAPAVPPPAGGPPADWLERVRKGAPHLLQPGPLVRPARVPPRIAGPGAAEAPGRRRAVPIETPDPETSKRLQVPPLQEALRPVPTTLRLSTPESPGLPPIRRSPEEAPSRPSSPRTPQASFVPESARKLPVSPAPEGVRLRAIPPQSWEPAARTSGGKGSDSTASPARPAAPRAPVDPSSEVKRAEGRGAIAPEFGPPPEGRSGRPEPPVPAPVRKAVEALPDVAPPASSDPWPALPEAPGHELQDEWESFDAERTHELRLRREQEGVAWSA